MIIARTPRRPSWLASINPVGPPPTISTSASIRLEQRLGAVHGRATQDHLRDAPRVADVVQRVRVEHDEVAALARLQGPRVGDAQELGAVARRHDDHLRGRHAGDHHVLRSEEHTSELQSPYDLVCRLLLEKKKYFISLVASGVKRPRSSVIIVPCSGT